MTFPMEGLLDKQVLRTLLSALGRNDDIKKMDEGVYQTTFINLSGVGCNNDNSLRCLGQGMFTQGSEIDTILRQAKFAYGSFHAIGPDAGNLSVKRISGEDQYVFVWDAGYITPYYHNFTLFEAVNKASNFAYWFTGYVIYDPSL